MPEAAPILVVSFGRIGDVVRSLSVVRMIAERRPDAPIDLMCRTPTHEIVRFSPDLRDVIVERTRHNHLDLRERLRLVGDLRKRRYGAAYILSHGYKAAVVPFLAGIPRRIGYFGEFRLGLINRFRRASPNPLQKAHEICLLALDPGETLPLQLPLPRLSVDDGELEAWRVRENVGDAGRPVVALAPGASLPARRWPIEHFVELARRANARGWAVWVIGAPDEKPLADAIATAAPIRDFTPSSLGEAAFQIKAASILVGNESGLIHVSTALGVPTVGMFGVSRQELGPINPLVAVTSGRPLDASSVMADVTVDQVDAAVLGMI